MNAVPNHRRGFTLIELLVVLTIIGLLAALLFPVFVSARERARQETCTGNLRQIAVAFQLYLQDDGGVYPLGVTTKYEGGKNVILWGWSQSIAPYLKTDQVLRCPDLPPASPLLDVDLNAAPGATGYLYDTHMLNVILPYPNTTMHGDYGVSEVSLATPATIWLNMDIAWRGADGDHYFQTVAQTSCGRSFFGSTLHAGGANYSFLDAHVKWLTPEQMGEVNCANGPPPAPFKN